MLLVPCLCMPLNRTPYYREADGIPTTNKNTDKSGETDIFFVFSCGFKCLLCALAPSEKMVV